MAGTDSYGHVLDCDLGEVHETEDAIQKATVALTEHFTPDGVYGGESEWKDKPGFIADVTDFSQFLAFGDSGDGSPFCFDYRDVEEPSVVWWDDVYWRRISPSFEEFLRLIRK